MEHFCKFNIAYRVNEGHHGDTDLTGAKFWLLGDLGHDFSQSKANWVILTFDPSVSDAQRAGLLEIIPKIYPLEWNSLVIGEDARIAWQRTKEGANAKLGGGKIAEIALTNSPGNGGKPIILQNLPYWGAPRHNGLKVMPNEFERYNIGEEAFEFKGTTGFMVTLDITSKDS